MKLFLDTEFNGFGGELISMAICAEDGREWYGVLPLPGRIHPWVEEHVVPFLDHPSEPDFPCHFAIKNEFQACFARFIKQFNGAEIIADWPSDLEHFCNMMTYSGTMAGWRIPIECTMKLIKLEGIKPEIPHNALSDARALRKTYLSEMEAHERF